jgi:hypothetical protein
LIKNKADANIVFKVVLSSLTEKDFAAERPPDHTLPLTSYLWLNCEKKQGIN